VKPDVAAPTAPDRRDGWDAGIKRLNARQRGKQASLVCRTAHTRITGISATGSLPRRTYRSHRHLRHRHVPEPRTPAHPPVRPPTRISSGPCTLRSPRSAIPMTPSVAPIRDPACPDADRAPLRPPPLTPRHELQRATAPGLAGSRLRSERVGGWRGPGPGPPVRSSGPVAREATHAVSEPAGNEQASLCLESLSYPVVPRSILTLSDGTVPGRSRLYRGDYTALVGLRI